MLKSPIGAAALLCSTVAFSQGIPVYDNLQMINMIKAAAAQAEDYAAQIKMLETQAKTLESQVTSLPSSLNGSATSAMQSGMSAIQGAGTSAMSAGTGQVQQQLNGVFGNPTKKLTDAEIRALDQIEILHTSTQTSSASALNAARQQDDLPAEASRINSLAEQSQAATGMLQAQQAATQVNIEVAQQLQKMRQQQLVADQASAAAQLQQQRKQEASAAISKKLLGGQ
jgi:P-type conjugative transfer protein TrbJ